MDSIELGKRIKEARIAKKMTQSEVVGTFITRNMLSQIESGAATPSVKTLEYLSRVLDLPLLQLAADQKEDPLACLSKAKKNLTENHYDHVLELQSDYPPQLSDEFSAIFSYAALALAKINFHDKNFQEAVRFAQTAIEYAEKGLYANMMIKSESIMLLNQAAEQLKFLK